MGVYVVTATDRDGRMASRDGTTLHEIFARVVEDVRDIRRQLGARDT